MGEPAAPAADIDSPCIGTCTLGLQGLCIGCYRSAEEITAWLRYSAAERRAIMEALPQRAALLFDDD
ncbi:MAG: DUF1289 domain-containing protein [Wenzhouxiangella sp.]